MPVGLSEYKFVFLVEVLRFHERYALSKARLLSSAII